jgi:Cellulase (glycosyl hydrolase family 5)
MEREPRSAITLRGPSVPVSAAIIGSMRRPAPSSRRSLAALLAALAVAGAACTHPGHRTVRGSGSPSAPASPTPTPSPSPSPTVGPEVHRISGWLHTDGTAIVDERGNRVRLLAMGVPGMETGDGGSRAVERGCPGWRRPSRAAYDDIPGWGFNAVRVPISWANLEPKRPTTGPGGAVVHHYDRAYLKAIDTIVARFGARGVAVVLDMHELRWSPAFTNIHLGVGITIGCGTGMPAWLYPKGGGLDQMVHAERAFFEHPGRAWDWLLDAWRTVVLRYADQPTVVGVDILNEPYDAIAEGYRGTQGASPASLDLTGFYTRFGTAIHAMNPKLLLIFEENRSKTTGRWSLTAPPQFANAVMSVHLYGPTWDDPRGGLLLDQYYRRSQAWGFPLYIGEFTTFGYTTPGPHDPHWTRDLRTMMSYCKRRHIGWTIWSYNRGHFLRRDSDVPKAGLIPPLQAGF